MAVFFICAHVVKRVRDGEESDREMKGEGRREGEKEGRRRKSEGMYFLI